MKEKQELLCKAHGAAYSEIKVMILKQTITEDKLLLLLVFCDRYNNELQEQNQTNEKFGFSNLKKKLEKDAEIAPFIQFSKSE